VQELWRQVQSEICLHKGNITQFLSIVDCYVSLKWAASSNWSCSSLLYLCADVSSCLHDLLWLLCHSNLYRHW